MPTVGLRNNNPGNLKREPDSTPYKGEIVPTTDPPWRQFQSMAFGYRAMFHLLIIRYILDYKLNTIEKIINRYAPPVENDTQAYINYVANRMGISQHTVIDAYDDVKLLELGRAISRYENGIEAVETDLMNGYIMLRSDMDSDYEYIFDEGRNPRDIKNSLLILGAGIMLAAVYFIGKKSNTRNYGKK